jgi:hypothetical protein
MSPLIMATADGMVIYFLGIALITSVALALASQRLERILAWTLTFASICIAIACWVSAMDTFREKIRSWQAQLIVATQPAGPTSSPGTQP